MTLKDATNSAYSLQQQAPTRYLLFFFFNHPAPPEFSPLSLPDALPISADQALRAGRLEGLGHLAADLEQAAPLARQRVVEPLARRLREALEVDALRLDAGHVPPCLRSEEHTSELQSQSNLVCRLLLEKK